MLPADFIRNIENSFSENEEGKAWLQALPSLLDEAARRWGLTIGEPFLLSYNYVCAAKSADGVDVVLKIGVPEPELTSEIEALRLYDGCGAARLIDADAEKGMLLEERLRPGTMLLEVRDDAQAMEIAAGVTPALAAGASVRSLWRPVPAPLHTLTGTRPPNFAELRKIGGTGGGFIRLEDWFGAFKELCQRFGGNTGPLPRKIFETAEGLVADFFAEDEPPVVLHGDFHHYNLLKAGDEWKVIDPKGVIGPRGYEVGPLLINPWSDPSTGSPVPAVLAQAGQALMRGPNVKQISERRFAILSEQLGMERSRIRGWGIAHAVLSACWSLDEQGRGGEHAIHCAEVFAQL